VGVPSAVGLRGQNRKKSVWHINFLTAVSLKPDEDQSSLSPSSPIGGVAQPKFV
jgi:hypothetical protein